MSRRTEDEVATKEAPNVQLPTILKPGSNSCHVFIYVDIKHNIYIYMY